MKRSILCAVIAVFCVAGAAKADHRWGLVGSYWDTSDADAGEGLGLRFSYHTSPDSHTMFDMRLSQFNDLADGSGVSGVSDVKLEVTPIEVGASIHSAANGPLDIYAGLGLGLYLMEGDFISDLGAKVDISADDEIGYYGLLGMEFTVAGENQGLQTSRVSLFVEAMYRVVDIGRVSSGPITKPIDGSLDGVGVNFGILFHW